MKDYQLPNYKRLPIIPKSAKGVFVYNEAGKDFLDLTSGISVVSLGHCNPEIVSVLQKQSELLWHTSNYFNNSLALELAEKLVSLTFADSVFFANSGLEANEAALKLARLHCSKNFGEQKNQIHAFKKSFHGRSLFTVTVGGNENFKSGFGPLPQAISHSNFNDLSALEKVINSNSCAVILELVQGEGGVNPIDLKFLQGVRELCDKFQVCLIFDEIQTGLGRIGAFYGYQKYGIEPDILTSAKALGNGFPISALLTKKHLAEIFQPGSHGSTFGGNPLACAVANKVVDIISASDFLKQVNQKAKIFWENLEKLNQKYNLFCSIRGEGMLFGAELKPDYKIWELLNLAIKHNLLVLSADSNVLRLLPALTITNEELELAFQRLDNLFQEFTKK